MQNDYLAIININGGGGSYCRDENLFEAVEGAVRYCVLDWSRYYKLEGSTVHVEIFNVAGHDRVHWEGGRGYVEACGEAEDVKILCEQVIPVELPELTGRMKVTGPKYLNQVERQCAIACAQ
jgi:hypothetical protein